MRNILAGGLVACVNLVIVLAVVAFGAVTVEYVSLTFAVAMLAGLLWVIKLLFLSPVSWKHSPMHLPVVAFMVYALARYLTSPVEYDSRLELFHISLYGFLFFLTINNCYRSRDRTFLVGTLAALAFLEAIYGFWQFATKSPMTLYLLRPEQYHNRGGGTFINPNHLAGFLEMVFALLLARITMLRYSRKSLQKSSLKKILQAYVALLLLAGLIATFSRGGWVATTVGLLTFSIVSLAGRREAQMVWPRVVVGVAGIVLIFAVVLGIPTVREYLLATLEAPPEAQNLSLNPSTGPRLAMWQASLKIIGDSPLFGTGPATWKWFHLAYRAPTFQFWASFAHNDFLNLAADYGLVGFALVAAIVGCFFWHARYLISKDMHSEERSFAVGSLVALVMILVHSLVDFNMHIPANALVLVTLIGFTVAMDDSTARFRRVEMTRWARVGLALLLLALLAVWGWFGSRIFLSHRYTSKGNEAKEAVDYNAAVTFYRHALTFDATFPVPYARLGDIYLGYGGTVPSRPDKEAERQEMVDYAVDMYHETLVLNPYQWDVFTRLGFAYRVLGEPKNALIAFEEALALDPNNASIYAELGEFYRYLGEKEKAIEAFKKSHQLNFWSSRQAELSLREFGAWP